MGIDFEPSELYLFAILAQPAGQSMIIDGRSAQSSTLVIADNQRCQINLPFGTFELEFKPLSQNNSISVGQNPQRLIFEGAPNPIGLAAALSISQPAGLSYKLSLVLYTIGDASSAIRVLHYTVS